jgi:hypothetical protein
VNETVRSPLINFSLVYFIGGMLFIVAFGYFVDPAMARFIGAAWVVVGIALALITAGAQRKATSELAHFVYLLGFAWLLLLLFAGVVVIWTGGIGVEDLNRLLS